jgi:hypothetical protein
VANENGLTIEYQPSGRGGRVRLTARLPDGTAYTDKIDVADADGRRRFLTGLCKGRKGIDGKAVAAELEKIAAAAVARPDTDPADEAGGDGQKRGRPNQADVLVALASANAELFHTPGGYDSEGFATVRVGGDEDGANCHKETWPISSKGFRRWLTRLLWTKTAKSPGSEALQAALNVLAGMAIHDGPEHAVAVRVAEHDGALYLDLGDAQWRAVRVGPDGWSVVTDCPVKFVRRRGMLALPEPVRGGSIAELRPLVNLRDDPQWVLAVAWLVAALRCGLPFPVLAVNGEQGSAKSTLCRMLRALFDPNQAPLRRPPRDERDLMIAAANSWVVGYDNLSGLSDWLSDAVCSLATGGGFGTRELYSDADEKIFDAMRPVMVNGIEDLAVRPDLLDRAITLTLPSIPDEERQDEKTLWRHFNEVQPGVLGALLDAVCAGLANLPRTRLMSMPRMADFAQWVVACEPVLPWKAGAFLAAYGENRGAANALALESAVIGAPVLALVDGRGQWGGTAKELLSELESHYTDDATRKRKDWPAGPRKLAGDLRRLAPALRREGIDVTFDREPGGRRRRIISLERADKAPSRPSPPSPAAAKNPPGPGRCRDDGDKPGPADRPGADDGFAAVRDGRDGRDGRLQAHSAGPESAEEEVAEWTG